ncbi:glycosyltransferase [Cesiribacter sp. SM1]|uniref:glycosyltransferase n=1 Tax=Cesiribacter sp. SM1 TaxID=2861196 RepID=UPI001CD3AF37|nr:glycosyltransferase [Cesiribacter sp. SM1]
MVTYNHEQYIEQAILGVINQNASFPIELVIGEDCSTDGTRDVLLEYKSKYPSLIKLVLQEENVGVLENFVKTLEACDGDYVALCDGDDYWTDPLKIQKQVTFLESNPNFSISFHNVVYIYEDGTKDVPVMEKDIYGIEDLLAKNFIATASCVFRKFQVELLPEWFKKLPFGDWSLHILNAQYGKIKYHDEEMAVYRIHKGGTWSGSWSSGSAEKAISAIQTKIRFFDLLNEYFGKRYTHILRDQKMAAYNQMLYVYSDSGNHIKVDKRAIIYYLLNNLWVKKYSKKLIVVSILRYWFGVKIV